MEMGILQDLEYRGLLYQVTDRNQLEQLLENENISIYLGVDPTGDSMHVGNLLAVMTLMRLQKAGHKPIALVGGATGLIGDPSGRSSERTLNEKEVVQQFSEKIRGQFSKFLDFHTDNNAAKVVNNYDWIGKIDLISFLRDIGKSFSINYMLAKESVSARLEGGISFTEFSYMILQAYDYFELYHRQNCRLQIGGSDQWGNITAGLELIRRHAEGEEQDSAFGLTIPLITKSDGTKFGKSASGAIWLDADKTSPYEFYQFWYNTDDRDVIRFIKYFTFLTEDEINLLEVKVKEEPEKREAQKTLAENMTKLVHGEASLNQAINISEALFSGDIGNLTASEIKQGFKDVPSFNAETEEDIGLIDLLVASKIAPSKRQAREDISNGAIYINGERKQELDYVVGGNDRIEDQFVVIRRGKKKYFLIKY
jgi:tyrosyl-tRNA synthetase